MLLISYQYPVSRNWIYKARIFGRIARAASKDKVAYLIRAKFMTDRNNMIYGGFAPMSAAE
jgi:hypothetical protein